MVGTDELGRSTLHIENENATRTGDESDDLSVQDVFLESNDVGVGNAALRRGKDEWSKVGESSYFLLACIADYARSTFGKTQTHLTKTSYI